MLACYQHLRRMARNPAALILTLRIASNASLILRRRVHRMTLDCTISPGDRDIPCTEQNTQTGRFARLGVAQGPETT